MNLSDRTDYLQRELNELVLQLRQGNSEAVALSVATLRQEIHVLSLIVDPNGSFAPRITSKDGRYLQGILEADALPQQARGSELT